MQYMSCNQINTISKNFQLTVLRTVLLIFKTVFGKMLACGILSVIRLETNQSNIPLNTVGISFLGSSLCMFSCYFTEKNKKLQVSNECRSYEVLNFSLQNAVQSPYFFEYIFITSQYILIRKTESRLYLEKYASNRYSTANLH